MKKPTKATLNKCLRGYRAAWISTIDEQIVGLLDDKRYLESSNDYHILKWGESKGWISEKLVGKYLTFYFTEKGMKEICEPLKHSTCAFTGRKV